MPARPTTLPAQVITEALWHHPLHAPTRRRVSAIGSLRYYRFSRRVRLDRMIVTPIDLHGGSPDPRGLPATLDVSAWNDDAHDWSAPRRVNVAKPARGQPCVIDLAGVVTRVLKVRCLRHRPPGPGPYTQWCSPHNVPYAILQRAAFHGRSRQPWRCEVPVEPALRITANRPRTPRGMTMLSEVDQVTFIGKAFAVGFSLRRPLLTHLGWDNARAGGASRNALMHRVLPDEFTGDLRIASGPLWRTLEWDAHGRLWGGAVEARGNVVSYRLHLNHEVQIDARFEVRPDGLDIHLAQRCRTGRPTLELDAWRLLWNGRTATVATLGAPMTDDDRRTGATALPAVFTAPGLGNLSLRQVGGDPVRLQVDSWRAKEIGWAGVVLGHPRAYPDSFIPDSGAHRAALELRVCDVLPRGATIKTLHPELRRNWGAGLMFRPELSGFSNHAFSTNCHLSQTGVTDLAACTEIGAPAAPAIELARHTVTLALMDGRGYGDHRAVYLDSDPSLLSAAGRVQQVAPDAHWLDDLWPFIRRACARIFARIDRTGLVAAPIATGDEGGRCLSTNTWDCVNFGGYDAYSNAETYRALRNAAGLARAAGDMKFRLRLLDKAAALKHAYAPCFFNRATGWFASWRSGDGQLHDHGMTFPNAAACLYGLAPRARARRILAALERRRVELGLTNFRYGLPSMLSPVRRGDYLAGVWGQGLRADGADAFGIFCNGMLTLGLAAYYIRAMTVFNFRGTADQIAREVLEGHALGRLVGGINTGVEFHTPEGMSCGYEGAYVLQFPALLAVAQHLKIVQTPRPEFWLD